MSVDCVTTPWSVPAIWIRICSCCAAGKTSIRRSIVLGALCVCTVPNTLVPRYPSAAGISRVPARRR